MTGPKHLWAGNWEDEPSPSHEPALPARTQPAAPPALPEPAAPPTPPALPEPAAASAERPTSGLTPPHVARRAMIAAGATLAVIVVAVALALTTTGGSAKHKAAAVTTPPARVPSLAATTPTTTQPPVPSGPPTYWLGMELITVPPGGATVETLKLGSEADRAGLSPGDVILEINGKSVSGAGGIASAISGKRAGDPVALQISHGSSLYTTVVTLGAPPTRHP